jgi:LEA14-like dessication related protein
MFKLNSSHLLFLFFVPFVLSSCWSYEEVELKSVDNVRLVGLSPTTLSLEISATIDNPNDYNIKIKDPDIDVYIEGNKVGKLKIDEALVLKKATSEQYTVPIHTKLDGSLGSLFPVLLKLMASDKVRFGAKGSFKGSAKMFSQRIDVDIDQDVDLSR